MPETITIPSIHDLPDKLTAYLYFGKLDDALATHRERHGKETGRVFLWKGFVFVETLEGVR